MDTSTLWVPKVLHVREESSQVEHPITKLCCDSQEHESVGDVTDHVHPAFAALCASQCHLEA